jgi:redox-sensitive bicupin YhaK (pirin superfamily)
MNPFRRDLHNRAVHGEALVWLVAGRGCHWREHSTSGDVGERILSGLLLPLQGKVESLQLWLEMTGTAGLDATELFGRVLVLL